MEPEKTTSSDADAKPASDGSQAPADALSRTPEELETEQANQAAADTANGQDPKAQPPPEKKVSAFKRLFRKINIYFLIFMIIVAVAAIITVVNYLNNQKAAEVPALETQALTEEALKQLANTDASVGDASQTLTIQGSAVIEGQTLMRGNLNVAGNFQSGGSIQGPSLTISGDSNLGQTQMDSLQVSASVAVQGNTTLRDLSVSGTSTFSGAMTASQITVTKLILSGNSTLEVKNHIAFTGPSPSRSANSGVLGNGGSASVNGSDTTGTVSINTGNNPTAGCFTRITFNQAFTNSPHVIVSPVGSGAGKTQYYVDRDRNGFSICTAIAAPANQTFAFDYFVTN